ncbi:MAG: DEAD/DEAH box helicase [Candidatus Micrarchaeia archaeon]
MILKYDKTQNIFFCISKFQEKEIPKKAGFRWNAGLRRWETKFKDKAKELIAYADEEALEMLRDNNIKIDIPEKLQLYSFQKAGVEWMVKKEGNCLIADEMGLGKTIQAIAYMNILNAYPVLIVCPASVKENWKNELQKWLVQKKKIEIVKGKNGSFPAEADIYIINYDIIANYVAFFNLINLELIILDEIHYIKNYKAQRTKATKKIRAKRKIGLSGTPLLNRPIELFPFLNYIRPDIWKDFFWYAKRYCNAYKDRFGWNFNGASNLQELEEKLKTHIMIRREKREVLQELPEKIRSLYQLDFEKDNEFISLENQIKEIYNYIEMKNQELKELKEKYNQAQGIEKEIIKSKINEYKKDIKSHWDCNFALIEEYRQRAVQKKYPFIIEFIKDLLEINGKIVLFCHHKNIFYKLLEEFKGISVGISGDTPPEKRQEIINQFQHNNEIKIFVGTIRACGEGITLTASSKVVFFEYDWTPARMRQAEDRLHRIGQKNCVNSYWFCLKDSIDEKFVTMLIEKIDIITQTLGDKEPDELFVIN